jgi:hypothetical protein
LLVAIESLQFYFGEMGEYTSKITSERGIFQRLALLGSQNLPL